MHVECGITKVPHKKKYLRQKIAKRCPERRQMVVRSCQKLTGKGHLKWGMMIRKWKEVAVGRGKEETGRSPEWWWIGREKSQIKDVEWWHWKDLEKMLEVHRNNVEWARKGPRKDNKNSVIILLKLPSNHRWNSTRPNWARPIPEIGQTRYGWD